MAIWARFRQIRHTAVNGPEFHNTSTPPRLRTLQLFHTTAATSLLLLSRAHHMVVKDGIQMG